MVLKLDSLNLQAQITDEGITAPDYQTILDTLKSYFCVIYGDDAYLEPDSKDGQKIALEALAIHDSNNMAVAVYDCFSPATARGAALSINVKINGIRRKAATNSTVDLLLTGTGGTTITNGSAKDANNVIWHLPASVTIGLDGIVTATATCGTAGAVSAQADSITSINTPTRGWLTVTNPTAATIGTDAETDAQLRIRQAHSVALPSLTPFDAVDGALANVTGVTRHKLYENDTTATDANGIPAHALSAIVDGGDATEIAQTLRGKKGQGVATYGTTTINVPDTYGNPHDISFSRSTIVPIFASLTIQPLQGYTTQVGQEIQKAISNYINSLTIGDDVLLSRIYSPANIGAVSGGFARFYDITDLQIGKAADALSTANIIIAYDEAPTCTPDNIAITVLI